MQKDKQYYDGLEALGIEDHKRRIEEAEQMKERIGTGLSLRNIRRLEKRGKKKKPFLTNIFPKKIKRK